MAEVCAAAQDAVDVAAPRSKACLSAPCRLRSQALMAAFLAI
jgi:hypothetical protein